MATKYDIKRFLERKSLITTNKLEKELDQMEDKAVKEFISLHADNFTGIKAHISSINQAFDKLVDCIGKDGTGEIDSRTYNSPEKKINDLSSLFTVSAIKNGFVIKRCIELNQKYKNAISESKREYVRLLSVTQTMSSKESIAYLKKLGFDTSELEEEKQTTALVTNIDTSKLYII